MDDGVRSIRTPDHRIRVFVSSTLKELAPERQAVREAIESMQLAPVMFELGARPHSPRELYRAYLAQSDVFLAVMERSRAEYHGLGDAWGEAMTLVVLGRIALATGALPLALERFERSLELASAASESLGTAIAQNHRGWARLLSGDLDGARDDFAESLDRSLAMGHDEGVAYGLEGFVGLRAAAADVETAGSLLGAAQALRRRGGVLNRSGFDFWMPVVARLREAGLGEALEAAIERGSRMSVADALALVR